MYVGGERERLLRRAQNGAFDLVIAMIPAATWETADGIGRWKGADYLKGPVRPLRSVQEPWGISGVIGTPALRLKQANTKIPTAILTAVHTVHAGGDWLFIGPSMSGKEPAVDLGQLEEFAELVENLANLYGFRA